MVEGDRRQHRAHAPGVVQHLSALFACRHCPSLEQLGRILADNRPEIGVGRHRVSEPDLFRFVGDQSGEFIGDSLHRQNAFDGRAALPRVFRCALDGKLCRPLEIARGEIVAHDQRIVAAEFERCPLITGLPGNELAYGYVRP